MGTWNNTKQIIRRLNKETQLIEVYRPSFILDDSLPANKRYNGFITDLRIKSKIGSIPEAQLPEFELGASKTQKMAVVRDLEYATPRFNCVLFLDGGDGWLPIFEFPLHNRQPYFVTEVLGYLTTQPAFSIAPNARLGVDFLDVGYGFPSVVDDEIIIYGVAREEYSIPDPPIIIYQSGSSSGVVEEMPVLTPISVPVTYVNCSEYVNTSSSDPLMDVELKPTREVKLLVWEALKMAQLTFVLNSDVSSIGQTLLEWPSQYVSRIYPVHVPVGYSVDNFYEDGVRRIWCEIQENKLLLQASTSDRGSYPGFGVLSGSVTFAIV